MRGTVFRQCWCREPGTRKLLRGNCPDRKKKGHGAWYARYDAPTSPGERRRQPVIGPFAKKEDADAELSAVLARLGATSSAPDRSILVGAYLDSWLTGKLKPKPSTIDSYREAFALYWKPALGHVRLVDLRKHHVAEAVAEMLKVNRPQDDPPSETLRRLLAVRAVRADGRRSTVPLSGPRVKRVLAPLSSALGDAVPGLISLNPCTGIEIPGIRRVRPLAWTPGREAAFWKACERALARAEQEEGPLSPARRQEIWGDPSLRPCPVMVWLPQHAGRFLDYAEDEEERLYALWHLASYAGPRRGEIAGLTWPEVSLDDSSASIRENRTDDSPDPGDPKSEAGTRTVPLFAETVAALRAWRKVQAADQVAWGRDWPEHDLVFTREDGSPVPPQWISVRFETLAFRAGLPPVRFHDLRHGAASQCKAAGLDTKFIQALLGHSKSSFTDDTYVLLFPEVAQAGAQAAGAVVPRRRRDAV